MAMIRAVPLKATKPEALRPCGQGKVREIEFFFKQMERLVSNRAVGSHGQQTLAARGEYFRAERRRWPTIPSIRRSRGLALVLQLCPQHLGLFSGFVSERGQSRLDCCKPGVVHFAYNLGVLRHPKREHQRPQR